MRNLVLVVEYDGTDFHGFAAQPGTRTVQGVLTDALKHLVEEEVQLYGAGRTDAGVHARGQVVHFHTKHPIPVANLPIALNRRLPRDLKVKRAREAPPDFHARFSAKSRVYHYTLYTASHPSVWHTRYACHYPYPLNLERMQQAAQSLEGEHDFRAFCADAPEQTNSVRHLYRVQIKQRKHLITFVLEGSAFMHGMVRLLVGSLVLVGRGKKEVDYIRCLLESENERASHMMPPQGLCLVRVKY